MEKIFRAINRVVPEMKQLILERLELMSYLMDHQPIGRKALADYLGLTERTTRTMIDKLREQALIQVTNQGVSLTPLGEEMVVQLKDYVAMIAKTAFSEREQRLASLLGVDYCIIVPGDGEEDPLVFKELSLAVQGILDRELSKTKNVIAVTSGQTLAQVGKYFTPDLTNHRELLFVPTRGGLNATIGIQSNTVGGVMAENTNSHYLPLFVPENLNQESYELFLQQPSIQHAIEMSERADCLLLSIGKADTMAERREMNAEQLDQLNRGNAVGEAFGVFFDRDGNEVLRYPRIGLQIEDIHHIPLVITVVSGANKKDALIAYYQLTKSHGWLVCDDALANQVLNEATH